MAELKTQKNTTSPRDFINTIEDEVKKQDALTLLRIFEESTGQKPVMWGASIIGYGMYHYKSERSSQEGDWPLSAFSPRKQNLTLYIGPFDDYAEQLEKLGKNKIGKGCLYIKQLSDVDLDVLKFIIKDSYNKAKKAHTG